MTETSFQELLVRQKESGLSVRDFCSNEGIPQATYYYWKNKINKKALRPTEFIPLFVGNHIPAQRRNILSRSNPITPEIHQQENIPLEFVFPNGTRMMIRNQLDPAVLRAIVHLYDWYRCSICTISCSIISILHLLIAGRAFTRSAELYPQLWSGMSRTGKYSFL